MDKGKSLRLVQNVIMEWGEFVETKLSKSFDDKLTLQQFKDLSKDLQAKRKQEHGYFIGCQMRKGVRHNTNMMERQLLTFDIDQGTPELLKALRDGTSGLGKIEYVVYSTKTHGDGEIKLRLVIPLAKLLPLDHYQAASRICAWLLDYTMTAVDTVSFIPGQIMYLPAHCRDVEPIFFHRKGPLIDIYRVMEDWGGGDRWKDIGLLPLSPRERGLRENSGSRAQNPLDKRGIVGAFCREYSIHDGIAEFLSDIYEPSEVGPDGLPQRYTYIPGTSSNGVQVYDDGHMQSWHGSDPASGMNLNIFDAVRIHRYGDLDTYGEKEITDPRQFRSFKAMEQWLLGNSEVMAELRDSYYNFDDNEIDAELEGESSEVTSEEIPDSAFEGMPGGGDDDLVDHDWRDDLDLTEKATIRITLHNIILILRNANRFKGRFGHNGFTHMDCLVKPLRAKPLKIDHRIPAGQDFVMLEDTHFASIRAMFEAPRGKDKAGWGMKVSDRDLTAAVLSVCHENTFHPINDYLNGLPLWDGVRRLDTFWRMTCHTPDTPYHRQAGRLFLTAAVARVYEPGCKFDFMPVIIGPQGIRKSTLVMKLGQIKWSGETEGHFDSKQKFVEAAMGFWFLEMGELVHFRRAKDEEAIKTSLSGTVDHVRLPYRKNPERIPRQFVMIGTTNNEAFLRDRHRRIWPILCGPGDVDIEWLVANLDQLFAEAVAEYRRMKRESNSGILPLYLTGEAATELDVRQDDHLMANEAEAMAGMFREYLGMEVPFHQSKPGWTQEDQTDDDLGDGTLVLRDYTCALELFNRCLGQDPKNYDQRTAQKIGDAMRLLLPEWRPGKQARCGKWGQQRTYRRINETDF